MMHKAKVAVCSENTQTECNQHVEMKNVKPGGTWAGHVARMGEESGVYRVLVGKPEGKRPLGRPRRRWVDDIRKDLQEV